MGANRLRVKILRHVPAVVLRPLFLRLRGSLPLSLRGSDSTDGRATLPLFAAALLPLPASAWTGGCGTQKTIAEKITSRLTVLFFFFFFFIYSSTTTNQKPTVSNRQRALLVFGGFFLVECFCVINVEAHATHLIIIRWQEEQYFCIIVKVTQSPGSVLIFLSGLLDPLGS